MNNICDIFLGEPMRSSMLRFLALLDKNFFYHSAIEYSGYMGVSVDRIKLIPLVGLLRKQSVAVYSVPIDYKFGDLLSKEQAFDIAKLYAKENSFDVAFDSIFSRTGNPLVWVFSVIFTDTDTDTYGDRAGGAIKVDKLDGHIWSLDESVRYMYDYNNFF